MTIDINGIGKSTLQESKQGSAPQRVNDGEQQTSRSITTAPADNADTVNITRSAVKLQAVEQQIANIPIVDHQRVEQLKVAIESGRYEVDAQRTADKFLQLENALRR